MTHQHALDKVNGDGERTLRSLMSSPWIQLAVIAFGLGVSYANLHAEMAASKLELQVEISVMRSDLHTMKVLACRSYPNDSVCAVVP